MIVQCEFCGRIRSGGPYSEWTRSDVKPDVVGMCDGCGTWRKRVSEAKLRAAARRKVQAPARPDAGLGADVFKGFED